MTQPIPNRPAPASIECQSEIDKDLVGTYYGDIEAFYRVRAFISAVVLSTSQPDPFNRRQVEAVCRAVCGVEGVDPDDDVFGDGCDAQWTRYADAVAAALAATPAVGGERKALEAARQEIVLTLAFLGRDNRTNRLSGTIDDLCKRLAKADQAILAALAPPPASPLRGRDSK